MRLLLAALAGAALMVPMDAFAQRQPGQDGQRDGQRDGDRGRGFQGRGGFGGGFGAPNPVMQALDTDRDGTLSAAELSAATANLKKLDKNNDGKVDQEELRPDFVGGMIARMMERDENKDKKLSKEEAGERMEESFADADKNKDGGLDEAELRAYFSERFRGGFGGRGGEGGRRPGGDGDRRPGRPGEGDRPARPQSDNNDVEL